MPDITTNSLEPSIDTVGACTGLASTSPTEVGGLVAGVLNLTNLSAYREEMESVISNIEVQNNQDAASGGYRYGYLVDLVNGGEFRFYVPEYDISTTTNWESISILGRSVDIKAYSSTNSREISVALELMAGEGLYKTGKDPVGKLHQDISFVQSLGYPDYSKMIILPPPSVLLYLGPNLKMRGLVTNVSVDYKKPFAPDLRPMYAELKFQVVHITENPPDYSDVRRGDFEGPYGSSHITSTEVAPSPFVGGDADNVVNVDGEITASELLNRAEIARASILEQGVISQGFASLEEAKDFLENALLLLPTINSIRESIVLWMEDYQEWSLKREAPNVLEAGR